MLFSVLCIRSCFQFKIPNNFIVLILSRLWISPISFADSDNSTPRMDNRNYVNSEYYAKLLREKLKRDNRVAKMQNRIATEKSSPTPQQRSLIPRKSSKSRATPEKLPKSASAGKRSDMEQSLARQRQLSLSDNDLLSQIDKSLSGIAQGFVYKKGN